jgi:L-seryl-tRNA(Ser) seleniumtransferase
MIGDLQNAVGAKIAEICRAESAMVTAGCWSALVLGTAGVLTLGDRTKIAKLPDVSSFEKNEVIVQRGQNQSYVHAITNTGIKPVVVDTIEDLEKAIGPKTAMMFAINTFRDNKNGANRDIAPISQEQWIAVAKKHNIPTMIDMAADVPPVENLWKFNEMGFSLVCVSGGKGLRGPQSAGILMGRKDLIASARLNAPPSGGNIGRGMKVNKEEILGMYAALDAFVKQDQDKMWKMWEEQTAVIADAAKKVKGVTSEVTVPPIANHVPTLRLSWDPALVKLTGAEMRTRLRDGNPSIEVMGGGGNGLGLSVWMMLPDEIKVVAKRIQEELMKAAVQA